MKGTIEGLWLGFAVLGLAACATTPQHRYARTIQTAEAANRPLVVYGLDCVLAAEGVTSDTPAKVVMAYQVSIGFINTAAEPIQKVMFGVTTVPGEPPVLDALGKPLEAKLTVKGPLAAGSAYLFVGRPMRLADVKFPIGGNCLHLSSIKVTYADQTTYTVAPQQVGQYETPQMRPKVRCAYFLGRPVPFYGPPSTVGQWSSSPYGAAHSPNQNGWGGRSVSSAGKGNH